LHCTKRGKQKVKMGQKKCRQIVAEILCFGAVLRITGSTFTT
jgi:hypothetical protein